jgi:hypothetical protein
MELDEFYDVVNEMFHGLRYHVRLADCQSTAHSPKERAITRRRIASGSLKTTKMAWGAWVASGRRWERRVRMNRML